MYVHVTWSDHDVLVQGRSPVRSSSSATASRTPAPAYEHLPGAYAHSAAQPSAAAAQQDEASCTGFDFTQALDEQLALVSFRLLSHVLMYSCVAAVLVAALLDRLLRTAV